MAITRQSHDHHMAITRQSHDHHMAITRQSHDHHKTITWPSHGHHKTITWSSHGHHKAITDSYTVVTHFMSCSISKAISMLYILLDTHYNTHHNTSMWMQMQIAALNVRTNLQMCPLKLWKVLDVPQVVMVITTFLATYSCRTGDSDTQSKTHKVHHKPTKYTITPLTWTH